MDTTLAAGGNTGLWPYSEKGMGCAGARNGVLRGQRRRRGAAIEGAYSVIPSCRLAECPAAYLPATRCKDDLLLAWSELKHCLRKGCNGRTACRKHIETPNEKKRRLEHEAREAEAARLAEIKRQEEAARKEEAEKQRVEQEKRDKLARKATRVEVSLRKFIGSHLKVLDSQKTVMGQKKEKPKKEKKKNDAGKKKKQPTPVVSGTWHLSQGQRGDAGLREGQLNVRASGHAAANGRQWRFCVPRSKRRGSNS